MTKYELRERVLAHLKEQGPCRSRDVTQTIFGEVLPKHKRRVHLALDALRDLGLVETAPGRTWKVCDP